MNEGKKQEKLEKQLGKHSLLAWLVTFDFLILYEDYLDGSACIPCDSASAGSRELEQEDSIL